MEKHNDLLADIDQVISETRKQTMEVRVDRLLESACPSVNAECWTHLPAIRFAYDAYVGRDIAGEDKVWSDGLDVDIPSAEDLECDCPDDCSDLYPKSQMNWDAERLIDGTWYPTYISFAVNTDMSAPYPCTAEDCACNELFDHDNPGATAP